MKTALSLIAACAALSALAGATLRWDAAVERPAPADWPVYRGESASLQPRLTSYGAAVDLSGATASLWWQTNGMGAAWWSAPATVSTSEAGRVIAPWAPSNDVGAASYAFFIRADLAGGGAVYRAMGTLAMRGSPGYSPTAQPPPTAQWVSPADLLAVSNALASAVQSEAGTRAAADSALSDAIAAAEARLTLADARRIVQADTNAWITVADGTGTLWRIEQESYAAPDLGAIVITNEAAPGYVYDDDGNRTDYGVGSVFRLDGEGIWQSTNGTVITGTRLNLGLFPLASTVFVFAYHDDPLAGGTQESQTATLPDPLPEGRWAFLYPFEDAITYEFDSTFSYSTTNAVRTVTNAYPLATQAGTVILLSDHDASADSHPTLARASAVPTFGQATNIASFVASATIPTNAVAGWLLYDPGSNMWLRVSVSNLSFTVWEVTP